MDIAALVNHCYEVLQKERDLSPENPAINALLGHYVTSIANANVQDNLHVLSDKGIVTILPELHAKLSQSEYCMERYYARQFTRASRLSFADLERFIYWDNYERLTEKEMALLQDAIPHGGKKTLRHVVFVGSGPLPLSALIMAKDCGYRVTGVDCDGEAITLSSDLIDKLDMNEVMRVHQGNGADYDYSEADIVFIASLILDKQAVLQAIKQSRSGKQTFVIIRSAEDLNALLYCPFKESSFKDLCFKCLGKTDYCPKTINTSLLYEL